MNKQELTKKIAGATGQSQKTTGDFLDAFTEVVTAGVSGGDKIVLVGFGTFEPRARKARDGRNPGTGEAIHIPATVVPHFSVGKSFKQAVAEASQS